MAAYIANAFSLNMIPAKARLDVYPVFAADIPKTAISAVGHASTAAAYSQLLGREVACSRQALALQSGDALYVGAIFDKNGKPYRLIEGQVLTLAQLTELRIEFRLVVVQ